MEMAMKKPKKGIGWKRAMNLMHLSGTRLVCMYTNASPDGRAHYLVPGGYVEPAVAEKIKEAPGVVAGWDGLFPNHDQTWRFGSVARED
jgi:hypothetical protein